MTTKIRDYMRVHHMIDRGDRIVMGVSGGADSVALLLFFSILKEEYDLELYAVHINHGIREEAVEDADYVKKLCEAYHIPFYLFKADIPVLARQTGRTEEEMGREYRYQQFYRVMQQDGANKLAVAHHMGDQAETVLFHLVRGTDLSGMAGIRPVCDVVEGAAYPDGVVPEKSGDRKKLIRPLLRCTKEELMGWLVQQNVVWREDATNQDNTYARNKLRNQVLPLLTQVNEGAGRHIAEFAEHAVEYEKFFQKAASEYMERHVLLEEGKGETDRWLLSMQEKILSDAVLYAMITSVCGARKDILREHVQAVADLLGKQSGKKVSLPYQAEAVLSYEKLVIRKCSLQAGTSAGWSQAVGLDAFFFHEKALEFRQGVALPQGGELVVQVFSMEGWTREKKKQLVSNARNLKNNYTKFFDCATIRDTLYVRTPESGDYFVLNDKGAHKKLSRYFIDRKIPSEERQGKLVVARGHEILWIVGERRCETYRINENTRYVLVLMYEGEKNELSY